MTLPYKKQQSQNALGQIKRHLKKLDDADLLELKYIVRDRLQDKQTKVHKKQMAKFSIGDTVSFDNTDETITGIIIRLNKKTATVATKSGEWRVSPSLLTKE